MEAIKNGIPIIVVDKYIPGIASYLEKPYNIGSCRQFIKSHDGVIVNLNFGSDFYCLHKLLLCQLLRCIFPLPVCIKRISFHQYMYQ